MNSYQSTQLLLQGRGSACSTNADKFTYVKHREKMKFKVKDRILVPHEVS